jgi:hypothetical protein
VDDLNDLQRVSPSEGRCEVSGKWKWKETLTFNGSVNHAKYLPRDTPNEGRGKVSGMEGDFNAVRIAFGRRLQRNGI